MPDADQPIIPQELKVGRAGAICIGVLVLWGIWSLVAIPLVPSLIGTHPVRLELLRGSTAALVAGGAFASVGKASLILALLAPVPALMLPDPFYYWAGRLWGPAASQYLGGSGPRGQKRTQRAMALIERFDAFAVLLAPILPIPSALIYAAAGWGEMRVWVFLTLDFLGTMIWIGLIVGLGYALGHPAVNVAHEISHYGLIVTIALVVVIFVYSFWRAYQNGDFSVPPEKTED